jgi:hypothetical protein
MAKRDARLAASVEDPERKLAAKQMYELMAEKSDRQRRRSKD